MVTGIALLLAAATPGVMPVLAPAWPAASMRKGKRQAITVFTAPMPTIDLRRFGDADQSAHSVATRPLTTYATESVAPASDKFRVSALVASDQEAQYTGHRLRKSGMTAGLSLRMTNDDGVLASQVGMAGPVGKALTRIALEAITPD